MSDLQLYNEIARLPDNLKLEVYDFVEFLKKKYEIKPKINERQYGIAKGFFKMSDDFDEPLEDFKDYM